MDRQRGQGADSEGEAEERKTLKKPWFPLDCYAMIHPRLATLEAPARCLWIHVLGLMHMATTRGTIPAPNWRALFTQANPLAHESGWHKAREQIMQAGLFFINADSSITARDFQQYNRVPPSKRLERQRDYKRAYRARTKSVVSEVSDSDKMDKSEMVNSDRSRTKLGQVPDRPSDIWQLSANGISENRTLSEGVRTQSREEYINTITGQTPKAEVVRSSARWDPVAEHWFQVTWPSISHEKHPSTTADFVGLARAKKSYSPEVLIQAMDCFAADAYWRTRLDLKGFCSQIARFLPKRQLEPSTSQHTYSAETTKALDIAEASSLRSSGSNPAPVAPTHPVGQTPPPTVRGSDRFTSPGTKSATSTEKAKLPVNSTGPIQAPKPVLQKKIPTPNISSLTVNAIIASIKPSPRELASGRSVSVALSGGEATDNTLGFSEPLPAFEDA